VIKWARPTKEQLLALSTGESRKEVDPAEVLKLVPLIDAEHKPVVVGKIQKYTGSRTDQSGANSGYS
jgi:hypothetical protein